jgi:gag-polypeptide of LTR copia-type
LEAQLDFHDLCDFINGIEIQPTDANALADYNLINRKLHSILMLITDDQANKIVEGYSKDAVAAYKALKDKYQSSNNERKLALRDAISSVKLKTGADPDDVILELESLRRQIQLTGGTVDDEMLITILLKALGDDYGAVKTMVVTSSDNFEQAKSLVRTHYRLYLQQSTSSTTNNSESGTALLAGKRFACDICKKDTHPTSECYYNKRRVASDKPNNSNSYHHSNHNGGKYNNNGKQSYRPKPSRPCRYCKKVHYDNECPNKDEIIAARKNNSETNDNDDKQSNDNKHKSSDNNDKPKKHMHKAKHKLNYHYT